MSQVDILSDKIKELTKLVGAKTRPAIPDPIAQECVAALDGLIVRLKSFLPPTPKEKAAAKAHSLSAQIVNFTSIDKDRKKFFTVDYFRKKFRALPEDGKIVSPTTPTTLAGLRDAVILYYFRHGQADDFRLLESFRSEIETDYKNDPTVKQANEAGEFLRKLLAELTVEAISGALKKRYPSDEDLKEFAKKAKLKIPPRSRRKGGVRKSIHELLADLVYAQGGIVRMKLDLD